MNQHKNRMQRKIGILLFLTGATFYASAMDKENSYRVVCVSFSPDGKTMITGSDDKTVRLWDTKTGEQLKVLSAPSNKIDGPIVNHSTDTSEMPLEKLVNLYDLDETVHPLSFSEEDELSDSQPSLLEIQMSKVSLDENVTEITPPEQLQIELLNRNEELVKFLIDGDDSCSHEMSNKDLSKS